MKKEEADFIAEVYSHVQKIEDMINASEYRDRIMAGMVIGLMDEFDIEKDPDNVEMKSLFSFNLSSRSELEIIKEIMDEMYTESGGDLEDMLGDLGISLN
jgi:protein tyrosine/serine phosphatase